MIFKERKIPKHLIIQDEYQLRPRSRLGFFKVLVFAVLVVTVTYIVGAGLVQF